MKKNKEAHTNIDANEAVSNEELHEAFSDAGQETINLLMIAYNKETKEFDLDKIEEDIVFCEKEFSKRHIAFRPFFMSALEVPNIKEVISYAVENNLSLHRATTEEEKEIEKELQKEENEKEGVN